MNKLSTEKRIRARELIEGGLSTRKVAEEVQISKATANTIRRTLLKEGKKIPKRIGGYRDHKNKYVCVSGCGTSVATQGIQCLKCELGIDSRLAKLTNDKDNGDKDIIDNPSTSSIPSTDTQTNNDTKPKKRRRYLGGAKRGAAGGKTGAGTTCTISGCNNPVKGKGLCNKHYLKSTYSERYISKNDKKRKWERKVVTVQSIEFEQCMVITLTNGHIEYWANGTKIGTGL